METGCQNIVLCSTILKVAFPIEVVGPLYLFPGVYFVFQFFESAMIIMLFWCYQRFKRKEKGKSDSRFQRLHFTTGLLLHKIKKTRVYRCLADHYFTKIQLWIDQVWVNSLNYIQVAASQIGGFALLKLPYFKYIRLNTFKFCVWRNSTFSTRQSIEQKNTDIFFIVPLWACKLGDTF